MRLKPSRSGAAFAMPEKAFMGVLRQMQGNPVLVSAQAVGKAKSRKSKVHIAAKSRKSKVGNGVSQVLRGRLPLMV